MERNTEYTLSDLYLIRKVIILKKIQATMKTLVLPFSTISVWASTEKKMWKWEPWKRNKSLSLVYYHLHTVRNQFFLFKYRLTFFMLKFDLNGNHDLQKKPFLEKNMKKLLTHMFYTHDVTCNMSRRNSGSNDIYKKDQ